MNQRSMTVLLGMLGGCALWGLAPTSGIGAVLYEDVEGITVIFSGIQESIVMRDCPNEVKYIGRF